MNGLRATFPAISRNEALARGLAAQFLMLMDPTVEELSDVKTAVSEAVTNAIVHAYPGQKGEVNVEFSEADGVICVSVADTGRGIEDVALARTPFYTTAPEAERTGLGFAVMEAFMDSVEVESAPGRGTRVTMKKRIGGNA